MIWSDEAMNAEVNYRREVLQRAASASRRESSRRNGVSATLRQLWTPVRAARHLVTK